MTSAHQLTPRPTPDTKAQRPHASEAAERNIIGHLLKLGLKNKANAAYEQVADLAHTDFSKRVYQLIWFAVKQIASENRDITLQSVEAQLDAPLKNKTLKAIEEVGADTLRDLLAAHTGDILGSAAIIRKTAVKRNAQRGIHDLGAIVEDDSLTLPQMMDKMLTVTASIASQVSALDGHGKISLRESMRDLARKTLAVHKALKAGDAMPWGVLSGYTALDEITTGWQRQELVIVTGRPGTGKSAFLNCLALNALHNNETVLSIPLEMTPAANTMRMVAIESGIPTKRIKTGQMTDAEMKLVMEVMTRIADHEAAGRFYYLTFDNIPTMSTIVGKINQHMAVYGADLILFDQLSTDAISPAHPSIKPNIMVSQAVTTLRGLAKTHNVPIVSAAQLNRQGVDRPLLSHLAESDSMGKVPDIVIALYTEPHEEGKELQETEFIFLKNREGQKATVKLGQVPSLTKFINLQE